MNRADTTASRRGGQGFTLVEVVIASGLLAAVVGGLFAACIAAISTQYMAANYYRATSLARNRIQRAAALPFETLPMIAEPAGKIDDYGSPSPAGVYTRETILTLVTTNCYAIEVRVHYPSGPGRVSKEPVVLHTMIARQMYNTGEL